MKYIDADRLKAEIEKHIKEVKDAVKIFTPNMGFFDAKLSGIYDILSIIDSLRQEQLPGIEENGIPGKDLIPVEWVDACEMYGKWKIVKVEQPDVFDTVVFQKGVQEGRRLEREDVKSIIQSRIVEILGDAQPNPILRMELQELIKKIEA